MARKHDCSPSTLRLRDGDVIEPHDRSSDCTVEEAKANGVYHPFKVSIEGIEAAKKINGAAHQTDSTSTLNQEGISHGIGSEFIEKSVTHASSSIEVTDKPKVKANGNGNGNGNAENEVGKPAGQQYEETQNFAQAIMEVQTQEKSLDAKEGSKGSAAAAEMTVVNETETAVLASDDMEVEVNQQVKVLSNMNPDEELAGRAKAMNKDTAKAKAKTKT